MLAKELYFDLSDNEYNMLNEIRSYIEKDIKYPIETTIDDDYISKYNKRSKKIWDDTKYNIFIKLYDKIKYQVKIIDHSTEDVMHGGFWEINNDTYIHYRRGGKLPPIIIINDNIIRAEKTPEVKLYILKYIDYQPYRLYIEKEWDVTILYQVNKKKLSLQKIAENHSL